MESEPLDTRWQQMAADVLTDMADWRRPHPKATLAAIEAALDDRWAKARAQIVADVALSSVLADLTQIAPADRPHCPQCGARAQRPWPGDPESAHHL